MDSQRLSIEIETRVRFHEVDSMGIVWHGSYAQYFEDAREAFGEKYGMGYLLIHQNGFYAPLVHLDFQYKNGLKYGDKMKVKATFIPTEAAKMVFEYEIRNAESGLLCTTGKSVQVFLDSAYQLSLYAPDFFAAWKQKLGV